METNKNCLISRQVFENNFEVRHFYRIAANSAEDSGWIFLYGEEDEQYFSSHDNFVLDSLSSVILNKPFIREYIDNPVGSSFVLEADSGRILDFTPQKTISFDRKIYAPNAARIQLQPLTWIKYHPTKLILPLFALFFLILAIIFHLAIALISIYLLTLVTADWARTYEHFKFGEPLPGLVVSTNPTLIAVTSDFFRNEEKHSVVKIIKVKLKNINGKNVKVRDRIGTVALYTTSQKIFSIDIGAYHPTPFNIHFIPINYATANNCDHILNQYNEDDWNELETRLNRLDKPHKIGLFKVGIEPAEQQ